MILKIGKLEIAMKKWWIVIDHEDGRYIQLFNWLDKEDRYFGYDTFWHDGRYSSFGFWFFNVAWSL